MNKFRIAAVQLRFTRNETKLIKTIQKYLAMAKRRNAKIVCFPEDTFYSGPKKNKVLIKKIQRSCKQNKIWAILSAHLKEGRKTYNSAVLINDNGEICGKHRKVHIYDDFHIRPGSKFAVYKTPFCKIGIAICWDISCPKSIKAMAEKGAMIIFCPMDWRYEDWAYHARHKDYEKKILRALILTRAFENQVYFTFCNQCSPKERDVIPYSLIAEPHRIIKEIQNREGMIVADINLSHIEEMRKKYTKECGWNFVKKRHTA